MKYALLFISGLMAISVSASTSTSDNQSFTKAKRVGYIIAGMEAIRGAPKLMAENIVQFLDLLQQTKCRSSTESLTLTCLQDEAQQNCKSRNQQFQKKCPIISDFALVNKMNEIQFVSKDERAELSQKSEDYHPALRRSIIEKHALLATEFLLLSKKQCSNLDFECLAKEIDSYCLENADVKNLPWQGCAGALTWFIGSSK